MSSATSDVKQTLEGYLAGRVKAERVVEAVSAMYYGETGKGKRETWRPLMEIIERAHPGVVELSSTADDPGFAVRRAERPFPKAYEAALRQAAESVLGGAPRVPPAPHTGLVARLLRAVRRVFTAST